MIILNADSLDSVQFSDEDEDKDLPNGDDSASEHEEPVDTTP